MADLGLGLGGATGSLLIGKLVDAVPRPMRVTAAITALLALTFLTIGWDVSLVMTVTAIFVWGALGWASMTPQQHTLMNANPHDGATAVAANASAVYLGSAIGSAIGAVLVNHGVGGANLAFAAVIPAVVALVLQLWRIRMAR